MQFDQLKRRDFITLLGGAAAWPIVARAQQGGKPATIGFLGPPTPAAASSWLTAFVQRLRELQWIEGRNVAIDHRWGEGSNERMAEIAAEFARLKVDVIFTHGTGAYAAKQATSTIPIVFALATDPVGTGLVASLARPGGNVTGLSIQGTEVASKRFELLRELVPGLRRLAMMANAGGPGAVLEMRAVEEMSRQAGLEAIPFVFERPQEIAAAFDAFKDRADALYVSGDPVTVAYNTLALQARLPTIFNLRDIVEAGGFASYGPNFSDLFRRAADFVDKILRGAKPADILVEQPTKFDLVINLTTAKALGLTIPESFLLRADEVIE
jgi:ABC-type uncharacterized transport system substrate-binding protein